MHKNINLIDTHAHLDFPQIYPRLSEVVKNAKLHNVKTMICISTNLSKIDQIIKITDNYKNIYFSVGVHPNEVENDKDYLNYNLIKNISFHKKCVGIGEGGLDYHYSVDRNKQRKSFITQINVAQKTGLPLIIHSRDADHDMIDILKTEFKNCNFNAILHCFSSGEKLARCGLDLNFFISFSGIITFNSATNLHKIVKFVPIEKILIETDSPYLAPNPVRGTINEPKNCYYTAKFLSNLLDICYEKFANQTYRNSLNVFKKIKDIL